MTVAIDEGSGPAVLLVHGQPGSGADWKRLAQLLSRDHRVVAPDRPGWGRDERPAMSLADNAANLAAIATSAGLEAPVTVVGHSLGGGVAIELALLYPDIVGSLVLLASVGVDSALNRFDRLLAVPALGDPVIRAGWTATRRGIEAARRLSKTTRMNTLAERFARLPSVRALLWLEELPMSATARRSFLAEQRFLLDDTAAVQRRLPQLRLPVVVVHGTADHIVPRAAVRALVERIPGAEFVSLEGEAHLVPFERPDLIAPIVRRYAALGR
ncbi:MAG: alpha/beta hydrolase [Acidimicrobiales bacterium]|jgi:pimeloyl-ACP methyl ester carboxylesterase